MSDKIMRPWTFNVECSTLPGEIVCVTGSCSELGNWKIKKVLRMEIDHSDGINSGISGFGGEQE